jgi:serine/threonine protein kinase
VPEVKVPKVIGDWKIIEFLGNGGMGMVVLGTHIQTGKQAAIKLLLPNFLSEKDALLRFRKEINALKSIKSPHVAELLDYSDDTKAPWYALEYVSDFSLLDTMKMHGKFSDEAWWNLAKGILKAVEAIHNAGVIHRDLKPANIMMSKSGPKIIDFGLAKAFAASSVLTQTTHSATAGTIAYMAPEQHEGLLYTTEKSDIYSIGVTLVEAAGVSVQEIWQAENLQQMQKNKLFNKPNLTKLNPAQRKFIEKFIRTNPEDRPTVQTLLKNIGKNNQAPLPVVGKKKSNKKGFMTKFEEKIEKLEAYNDRQAQAAAQRKADRKAAKNQPIGKPAESVPVKMHEEIFAYEAYPLAKRTDRMLAYLLDIFVFSLTIGLAQLYFLQRSNWQLTAGRTWRNLVVIDDKTHKPVTGSMVFTRGFVLHYLAFSIIPFLTLTERYPWTFLITPIGTSLLMFLPFRKNAWDFATKTTIGKFEPFSRD